jgi:hypothetical protein
MNRFKQISKYALMMGTIAAFTAACSDDDDPAPVPEVKLLPVKLTDATAKTSVAYTYDTQNQISSIEELSDGNVTTKTTTFVYNTSGNPIAVIINDKSGATATAKSYGFTYDSDTVTVNTDDAVYTLTLSGANLVKQVKTPTSGAAVTSEFTYDTAGNLTKDGSGNTYSYDTAKSGIFKNSATPNWVVVFLNGNDVPYYTPNLISIKKLGSITQTFTWSGDNHGLPTTTTTTTEGGGISTQTKTQSIEYKEIK